MKFKTSSDRIIKFVFFKFFLQAKKCKIVENAPKVQEFGNKSRITVDAREAGDGAVTCKIISDTGRYVDE